MIYEARKQLWLAWKQIIQNIYMYALLMEGKVVAEAFGPAMNHGWGGPIKKGILLWDMEVHD